MGAFRTAVAVLSLSTTACAAWAAEGEKGEKVELVGVLKVIAAIGGETTGFAVEIAKGNMQEVSGDAATLAKFVDKKVRVRGSYYEKTYVERGKVKILKVDEIEAAE